MFFSNPFGRNTRKAGTGQHTRRLVGFEQLEARTLLAIDLAQQEWVIEFSEIGIPEDAPPINAAELAVGPIKSIDEGDFYYHFDEQIELLRAEEQVLIRIAPLADPATVIAALTGEGGALRGLEARAFNGPRRIAFQS